MTRQVASSWPATAPTMVPITCSAMRRSLTSRGSRSGGRATLGDGAAQLKLEEPRQHRVVNRLSVDQSLALNADFTQQVRQELPAGPRAPHLDGGILLHVVEEVLKRRLDPEVHLPLVRNDPVPVPSTRCQAARPPAVP